MRLRRAVSLARRPSSRLSVVWRLLRWETFLRFYPLTGNVVAFVFLLGIARQRPLVVAFTILTAIQLNAVVGMFGHAASLTVDPAQALVVNLAVRAALAVPLVWVTFRFFRPYYLEAARTMRRGWGLLCLIPLAFYALFYLVYICLLYTSPSPRDCS